MCKCLIRYDTICVTLLWSMEAGYWITIFFSLTNVIIMLWFSLTPLWIPWLFPTFPDSVKKSASTMNFSDCINPDFCEVIVTSIKRTWRKILDFLVRKFSVSGQLLHIFEQIARKSAEIARLPKIFSPEN